ncbi:PREDICTED: uncharacterized protein LOC108361513 [Rhagoletis zephyria]|uniref:uncharacterized protein LOC108361513 n=1 Tax=Rhagoletis zephyria TaxID=28612 RepID=UPI000811AA5B|nr:PREDICTED: uncharacterized protein LOC108361513 [Rhagoletis zephyria]
MSEAMDSNDSSDFVSPSGSNIGTKKRVRKLKEKWTNEQTERLVQEVEAREGTWNFLSTEYRDRNMREAQWQDVADILKMPRSEVSAKWNSLRCSFRAAFNRKGHTKTEQGAGRATAMTPLYNSLKFLEPTLRIEASTTSNLGNKCPSPLNSSGSPGEAEINVESDDSQPTPSTSRAAVVQRRRGC